MLTAHQIKILQSLDKKKFRQKYNLFLVEGNKIIKEIVDSAYKIKDLYSINPNSADLVGLHTTAITEAELRKISMLQHPKDSVAVCEIPAESSIKNAKINLILDGIQDPGNLGTIIRLADWFGITQIICSTDTVDCYNPKVIQASMGSFLRVNCVYSDIQKYLQNSEIPNIGTDMQGKNLYQFPFPESCNLILGNEGNGIRTEIEQLLTSTITIPRFGKSQSTESLNVSMATGIILGQLFSKKY